MHLCHVHAKINISSLNNEDKCPRQQHHVTVISLLIKKAAVILAEQYGQIQCTMDWYFWGKTGKYPLTCCVFSSVIMQFCVTWKFLIQTGLCSQRTSSMQWSVMVVMAVDYPILSGTCTYINIRLFSGNENNIITCLLLIHLGIYVVSQALWQMYSYEQLLNANCALWKKWHRKLGVIDTKSTLICKKNIKNSEKKTGYHDQCWTKRNQENLLFWNKVWFNSSVNKWGNFCAAPSIFVVFVLIFPCLQCCFTFAFPT